MVKIYKFEESRQIGFQFSGENFREILNIVKSHKLTYNKKHEGLLHLWTCKAPIGPTVIAEIQDIEPLEIPNELEVFMQPVHETRNVRRKTDPMCYASKSMGEYQDKGIELGIQQNRVLYAWEMGTGKAQSLSSCLYTKSGPIKMGAVRIGDEVATVDGSFTKVTGIYPQGEQEVFEITFTDGSIAHSTNDHLWNVITASQKNKGREYQTLPLSVIRQKLQFENGNNKWYIPICEPVEFSKNELPIDPYVLGVLIGDGCFRGSGVKLTTPDKQIVESVRRLLPSDMEIHNVGSTGIEYTLVGKENGKGRNSVLNSLRDLGLHGKMSYGKSIPAIYKYSSISDRVSILQGLLDTDGYSQGNGNISSSTFYSTSSYQLARDFVEIVQSLGGTARVSSKIPKIEGKEYRRCYTITVRLPHNIKNFRLNRKQDVYRPNSKYPPSRGIISVKSVGTEPTQCISVEHKSQLYLTNGFIVTHNTFTVLTAINHLWAAGEVDRLLIIAPTESVYNFRREILQFNTVGLVKEDIAIANVNNRTPFDADPKVVIMTYRTFLMLSDDAYKKATGKKRGKGFYRKPPLSVLGEWGTKRAIVLDESHNIKNSTALQSKALHLHKQFFEYRYLLSGTPAPNGPNEMYSQLTFLDETIIPESYQKWVESIAAVGSLYSPYAIRFFYPEKVEEFYTKTARWVSRETTEGNLELPDLIVKNIFTEMGKKQRGIYQEVTNYVFATLKEEKGEVVPKDVVNKFPFIMQALDNPSLLKGKLVESRNRVLYTAVQNWKFEDHCKLEVTDALIDKYAEEGNKIILWSGHPLTMDQLSERYKKYNPTVIHGAMDVPKGVSDAQYRSELLEGFKTKEENRLLIASYMVLSTAVNIVEAKRAIYFDRSWNLTHWLQSIKRTHRIGQEDRVIVNPILIEDSLDLRLDKILTKKEGMNEALYAQDSLSKDEWMSVFSGEEI